MLKHIGTLFFIGFLSAGAAWAVEETPRTFPAPGKFADVDTAKAQFDKGAVFVDARVAGEYVEKRIKGAINVVYRETHPKVSKIDPADRFDVTKLPSDKSKTLVFYCNGSPCWRAYKGAVAAMNAGYKNVYWFRDGLPAWVAKGYPTE